MRKKQHALISVKDRGYGIPAKGPDTRFTWFGRTRVKATDGERITRLGLAIGRRIVLGHQGELWVDSEESKRSTLFVSLPSPPMEQTTARSWL